MTKQDFDTLLKEQVRAMVAAQMAVAPSDMSVKGETIKPLLVNGVKYVTRADASKLLGKSYHTLFRYNRDGILKGIKMGPRSVYYRYDDVVSLLGGKNPAATVYEEGGRA